VRLQLGNGVFEGRELIQATALEPTHTPAIGRGPNYGVTKRDDFYGLGWGIDYAPHGTTWRHAGAFEKGARTQVMLLPARQVGIVVLTNAFPTGFPEAIADSFFDIVFDGAPSRDWTAAWNGHFAAMLDPANWLIAQWGKPPDKTSPALPPDTYAGTYANDYLGQVRVFADGADLMLALGAGGKITHRLTHFDRDTFTIHAFPEWPDVPSPVVFSIGEYGKDEYGDEYRKATTLTITWLNEITLRRRVPD
jgi:CubicO group peptidase (beta-lactamase class C family)